MSKPEPKVDPRRAEALLRDLLERAQTWIPEWRSTGSESDLGHALLRIAARLGSEVNERLDRTPTKVALGLLDWLGITRQAGHAARMPIVFKMGKGITDPVLAPAPIRVQANSGDTPTAFETQQDVQLVSSPILQLVGVDPIADAIYLPPTQVLSLELPEAGPNEWILKSFATLGSKKIQLSPPLGLPVGTVVSIDGLEYRIAAELDGDIALLEPSIGTIDRGASLTGKDLQSNTPIKVVQNFAPFDGTSRNQQAHELYIGDENALNLTAPACIALDGGAALPEGVEWEYWGKVGEGDPVWLTLERLGVDGMSLLLKKPKAGSIEISEQDGKSGRWIRARQTVVNTPSVSFDQLSIRVNCDKCDKDPDPAPEKETPKLEGVANNTSLVLNDRFYPFGKIPRQFDSFFLACPEVFSKPAAQAKISFTMADPTIGPLAIVKMRDGAYRVFGVANDGALHSYVLITTPEQKLDYRGPLRPPVIDPAMAVTSVTPAFEGADAKMPPVVVVQGTNVSIVVWSKKHVWIYQQEIGDSAPEGNWKYFGSVGDPTELQKIVQIVLLGNSTLIAVAGDGSLYHCDLQGDPSWRLLDPDRPNWTRLVPIQDVTTGVVGTSLSAVFFAVAKDKSLSRFVLDNGVWSNAETLSDVEWANDFTPIAISTAAVLLITGKIVGVSGSDTLGGMSYSPAPASLTSSTPFGSPTAEFSIITSGSILGAEFGWAFNYPGFETSSSTDEFATLYLLLTIRPQGGGAPKLVWWTPLDVDLESSTKLVSDPNPIGTVGTLAQNPVLAGNRVIVPGPSRNVFVANFVPLQRILLAFPPDALRDGMTTTEQLGETDFISLGSAPITPAGLRIELSNSNRFLYSPKIANGALVGNQGTVYPFTANSPGFVAKRILINGAYVDHKLVLETSSQQLVKNNVLLLVMNNTTLNTVEYSVHQVTADLDNVNGKIIATVDGTLPDVQSELDYYIYSVQPQSNFPQIKHFRYSIQPTLSVGLTSDPGNLIKIGQQLHFLDSRTVPKLQLVTEIIGNSYPVIALLERAWEVSPMPIPFLDALLIEIDNTQSNWTQYSGDVSSNPDLSWEYWNGTGWWKLDPIHIQDGTANLKQNGDIQFAVPEDLRPTDVLGRQSHWIRARLVGGDYGREIFKTKTITNTADNSQIQSVVVDTDNIRAPIVLSIGITYSICIPIFPKYLLTLDSGSWRDQSDANRTSGATVDAFVSIAKRLQQISKSVVPSAGSDSSCPPPCGCDHSSIAVTSLLQTATENTESDSRAIYLVFANKFQGGPIRILFLLHDRDHDIASPLIVEILRNNRFEMVLSQDDTRGLGESGVVTLWLDGPPTESELFGFVGFWLRLRPRDPATSAAAWQPNIRGAYANAVWAEAAETQEMEILGSSDGSPLQRLILARPPVLKDSLELRVREPLGDEEKQELDETLGTVMENVPGLPGSWVRWAEVVDPGDAGPDDRVYALDFASGEISFGDGVHGYIPPVGRDAVVAFKYRHGGAAAANTIQPFSPLNLVTSIEGVEAVIAPDHAAGGADPENVATVRRFASARLRHRERAITLKDLEDLALNFTPDIAQSRAFPIRQGAKLVVVVRGSNPDPTQALSRELRHYLLERASPELAKKGALVIVPAGQVPFRLQILLSVASIDVSGQVSQAAKQAVEELFDAASGGYDGFGWRVGASPGRDDVAARLITIDGLDGIDDVRFTIEGATTDADRVAVKADQLVRLLPDGTNIQFTVEKASP